MRRANSQNPASGMTLLHYAAGFGDDAVIWLLADVGGDLRLQDRAGHTPADYAIQCGSMKTLALLKLLEAR